ncbi:MAG: DUF1330 domain-containing protein [Marinomonas colpomeniae]
MFERIMALEVSNDEEYQKYRESMTPILHSFGGRFGYDFKVSDVLQSKTKEPINRVFTIDFPSKEIMDQFFSNPDYLNVKEEYFNRSVASVTIISMHEKNA